jgi:hypothetical protein
MSKGSELRRTADLFRRMAETPTEGGHHEDRLLFALAEQLEHEAAAIEAAGVYQGEGGDDAAAVSPNSRPWRGRRAPR